MPDFFVRKLRCLVDLSMDDEERLRPYLSNIFDVDADKAVIRQGSVSRNLHLMVEGMACRVQMHRSAKRTICGILLPGDLCRATMDLHQPIDHSIITMSRCRVVKISERAMEQIVSSVPQFITALWRLSLAEQSLAREWFSNVAHRPANQRTGHLLCEIVTRLQAIGLAEGDECEFPFSQAALSEMLGISAVHVNRVLKDLRADNLITLNKRRLQIPNFKKLRAYSQFTPVYLQLNQTRKDMSRLGQPEPCST